MFATINHKGKTYKVDFSQPIDISIPLRAGKENVNAWYVDPVKIEPVRIGDWVGEVNQGGSVNFRNISFNPHGNGTHTECVGHISKENFTINQCLKQFFFVAEVISVIPTERGEDYLISAENIKAVLGEKRPEALIIRTLSNPVSKINMQYSNTNPPYLDESAATLIHELNIEHLLIDLPSVDKEKDDGKLTAHHIFWQYPHAPLTSRTITELIYVPNTVLDGTYFMNLQIASFENDASPSKPVLFRISNQS